MKLTKPNEGLIPTLWNTINDEEWFRFPDRFKYGSSAPAVNVLENDDHFTVEMAVPGMKKEDFAIDLNKNVLTISAEERTEKEETGSNGNYTRREFNYSGFNRSFTLPEMVDGEKISASYQDGILEVTIPKKEEAKPKPPKAIKVK